jgi:hypothetical protein
MRDFGLHFSVTSEISYELFDIQVHTSIAQFMNSFVKAQVMITKSVFVASVR